jgi:hypothetical protein
MRILALYNDEAGAGIVISQEPNLFTQMMIITTSPENQDTFVWNCFIMYPSPPLPQFFL